ncbi:M56 family metallopeptidase [Streptomyces qinglanensis]|uniref:Signal transducer regulating beta-lactamase production, contains metallopeptidase domain n=1 Tax=Streptomyces qinglanensis TaxID=943816 RepID=A0A1H9TXQ4_9ACTN|nr:M56 family metallopeptidase [Streptomyces qinglanensis]SES01778.1 Signal transducer regulating beta-lactamase production, contains metallopeptidase domain [Streptomyces qinglanensis]
MTVPLALMVLALFAAGLAPRVLTRSTWPDREPVLALWVWQCVVGAVLLCCLLAMALSGAAAFTAVRSHVFAGAPHGVAEAYSSSASTPWAGALSVLLACGGAWTGAMLLREIKDARARRRRRRAELRERAPRLPGESASSNERLVVLEEEKPDAWWLPGANPQLAITTGALRRLKGRQLDAVLEHEQGHARARHDWLLHCSSALAAGFSRVPVFAGFRDQVHRLVELAADDAASRRYGRLTIALALVELNEGRGVFGPCPTPVALVPQRVHRLLAPGPRLSVSRRLRMTAVASLVPVIPVLVAFAPGLSALRH